MMHEMQITRVGYFGAIAAYCKCGWMSKQMTGAKQIKKANKAFRSHNRGF